MRPVGVAGRDSLLVDQLLGSGLVWSVKAVFDVSGTGGDGPDNLKVTASLADTFL